MARRIHSIVLISRRSASASAAFLSSVGIRIVTWRSFSGEGDTTVYSFGELWGL